MYKDRGFPPVDVSFLKAMIPGSKRSPDHQGNKGRVGTDFSESGTVSDWAVKKPRSCNREEGRGITSFMSIAQAASNATRFGS